MGIFKMIYVVEVLNRRGIWEPTGPNWWFTKIEAHQAKSAFGKLNRDQKYRVGAYGQTSR